MNSLFNLNQNIFSKNQTENNLSSNQGTSLFGGGLFTSNINNDNKSINIFKNINNNQEDDEHCCEVINDEKIELSQIKESENESLSGTESAFKSRKDSQHNLQDNNSNEDKKEDEFLKPLDVNINISNRNEINNNIFNNNISNNNQLDFEDQVNRKYGLFPIL